MIKWIKTEYPLWGSAVQLWLSVSPLRQRKDSTRRPSWFGGDGIRGCWCIDSYPLLVYESYINGWDSHYLHACLLSPTSAGKISPHLHPACFCHTHVNLSPSSFSLALGPISLSFQYAAEIKGIGLVFMCHFRILISPSPPFFARESSSNMLPLQNARCAALGPYMNLCEGSWLKTLWKNKVPDRKLFFLELYWRVFKKALLHHHICVNKMSIRFIMFFLYLWYYIWRDIDYASKHFDWIMD